MGKLRAYPARSLTGNRPVVQRFTLKSGETFKRGDLVTIDSNEDVLECSGDPSSVLGVAAEDAADVIHSGYVNVWLAEGDTIFAMQGDNAPTADDVNQKYGVVDTSNVWLVDGTDTSNVVVHVQDIDTEQELYFVRFLPSVRVFDYATTA